MNYSSTEAASKSPASGKLFFYRAWVATIGLGFVAYALLAVGQTSELLWGLSESMQRAALGLVDPRFRWGGFKAFLAFWFSSLTLAAVLALVVRVTGVFVVPRAIHQDEQRERCVRTAATVWAQTVLVATLAIIHFAFMSESNRAFVALIAFALMFAVLVLPLLLVWIFWPKGGAKAYLLAYGLCLGAFVVLLWIRPPTSERDLAEFLSPATPSLALLAALTLGRCWSVRDGVWLAWLAAVTGLLTIAAALHWTPATIWAVGTIPVTFVFFAWAAGFLAFCAIVLRAVRADAVIVIVVIAIAFWMGQERIGQEVLGRTAPAEATPEHKQSPILQAAPSQQDGSAEPAPAAQFAVHADGGGLRAALFTAEVLALADDLTCGDFGSRVFAASGVSGGSLGIATWAVTRQAYLRLEKGNEWSACKYFRANPAEAEKRQQQEAPTPLGGLVHAILVHDHLSTAVLGTLTSDFLWAGRKASRGQALVDSWQEAALSALAYAYGSVNLGDAFATPLKEVDAGLNVPPILMFTATDADSGGRVVFSNAAWAPTAIAELPTGVAALHSARFPLISPPGLFIAGETRARVVDGGFFDNSGAATLREMMQQAASHVPYPKKLTIVRINGNAVERGDERCKQFNQAMESSNYWPGSLPASLRKTDERKSKPTKGTSSYAFSGWSGFSAYTAARTGRADEAVKMLAETQPASRVSKVLSPQLRLDYYAGFVDKCIAPVSSEDPTPRTPPECVQRNQWICAAASYARRAPLGWYLSPSAGGSIARSAASSALRLVEEMKAP